MCVCARARYLPRVVRVRRKATGPCVSTVGRLRCVSYVLDCRVALGLFSVWLLISRVGGTGCKSSCREKEKRQDPRRRTHGLLRRRAPALRPPRTRPAHPRPAAAGGVVLGGNTQAHTRAHTATTLRSQGKRHTRVRVPIRLPQALPLASLVRGGAVASVRPALRARRTGQRGGRQRKTRQFSQILSLVRAGSPWNVRGGARKGKWGLWGEWLGRR